MYVLYLPFRLGVRALVDGVWEAPEADLFLRDGVPVSRLGLDMLIIQRYTYLEDNNMNE